MRFESHWEAAAQTNPVASICWQARGSADEWWKTGVDDADKLAALVPPGPIKLLVIGCGSGRVTRHLADRYKFVYATDISPTMLAMTKAQGFNNVETVLSDGTDFEPTVDAAYSYLVLMHNYHEFAAKIMWRTARCLPPGGPFALQLPVYQNSAEPEDWNLTGCWTADELRSAADDAGFDVEVLAENPGEWHEAERAFGPRHYDLHLLRKR